MIQGNVKKKHHVSSRQFLHVRPNTTGSESSDTGRATEPEEKYDEKKAITVKRNIKEGRERFSHPFITCWRDKRVSKKMNKNIGQDRRESRNNLPNR